MMQLDEWQQKVLETEGNICLRSGRQVGKTTIVSIKAGEFAAKNRKKTILMIASVERQAFHMFYKTLNYLNERYPKLIKQGRDRPTKHVIKLINGSEIYCLPTGLTGQGIRGFTIDLLIADEAAFIPEEVWTAVIPELAVTKGKIMLLSTPHGKRGYYYECFRDKNFSSFHVSSEECSRVDKEFLEREKGRMTNIEYAQEYLGEFIDELVQLYPDELIKSCMKLKKGEVEIEGEELYMGVDVARLGGDENVIVSGARKEKKVRMFDMDISERSLTTETVLKIKKLDKAWRYKKIYIDDGGLGVAVFDPLLDDEQTKRKVVAINNASRNLNKDKTKKKKLFKEDLHMNLLRMMEAGEMELLNDEEIFLSLKSVQYEYTKKNEMRIFGRYTHVAEAIVRLAWCVKDKSLNLWIK